LPRLPISSTNAAAAPRTNGTIFTPGPRSAEVAYGAVRRTGPGGAAASGLAQYSLDFSDTDIREVTAQILGSILGLNYAIDPEVKGTATLHTAHPVTAAQLLPALQTMLGSVGAVLVRSEGL
jgi:general secretion pathway protein D